MIRIEKVHREPVDQTYSDPIVGTWAVKAMILERPVKMDQDAHPLRLADVPIPTPGDDEVLIQVHVCGVCHTELDEIEGRLKPTRLPIILGHQVVGTVVSVGSKADRWPVGSRVGVGWIHRSCGGDQENLSPDFVATGCDVDGGYAEYMTAPQDYVVPIPDDLSDAQAAPLMCAGAIGFRALRLSTIENGDPLGLMGFGGSGHLVLQMAKYLFPKSPVYVFHRRDEVRQFALDLGADWAGDLDQSPPRPAKSIIDTTPAWRPIVESLGHLAPGGRLVINAIRKEDLDKQSLMNLSYHDHLWKEKEIKTVANLTYRDLADFMPLAAEIPLQPTVKCFPLEQANEALGELRKGGIRGANVLRIRSDEHAGR